MPQPPQPRPGDRPNPWSNAVIGQFSAEAHARFTPKKGVHHFSEFGMSSSKATKILSKVASRAADDQIEAAGPQKQKGARIPHRGAAIKTGKK